MKSRNIKVGWVLTRDYKLASSRLQGHRVSEYFTEAGLNSSIIAENFYQYEDGYSQYFFSILLSILEEKYDVVFFQKPGWMSFKLSEFLRLNGVNTIAIQCDPFPGQYSDFFDITVFTTRALKKMLNQKSVTIIDDMLESPVDSFKLDYSQPNRRLKIVWVGQGTPNFISDFIKNLSSHEKLKNRIEVVSISNTEWATYQWSLESVYTNILQCDIAIIPLPIDARFHIKSTNRLTLFMSLGMPTIVTPIPSYLEIAKDGRNCILANSLDEFVSAILTCEDEVTRKTIGLDAKKFARKHYSPSVIGKLWLELLDDIIDNKGLNKPISSKIHIDIINYALKGYLCIKRCF